MRSRFILLGMLWALLGACSDGDAIDRDVLEEDLSILMDQRATDQGADDVSAEALVELDGLSVDQGVAPDPGTFGAPCVSNEDCESGYCIEGHSGYVCTETCIEECPDGYRCVPVNSGPDINYICVPIIDRSCEPCSTDLHCAGGFCVPLEGGSYCLTSCEEGSCNPQYQCQSQPTTSGNLDLCTPVSGTCECTAESLGLEKACKKTAGLSVCYGIQFCEAEGWGGCELPEEICDGKDNDCDGNLDEPFLNTVTGRYESDIHCGACGNSCAVMTGENAQGKCYTGGSVPACRLVCDSGYFDVNMNPTDGCECEYLAGSDDPDVPGDANCDGLDGVATEGLFVAKNGDDSNSGSMESPMLTIQAAIDEADGREDISKVYVASGVYSEAIAVRSGVSLYGGYSPDFLMRDIVSNQTVIMGTNSEASLVGAVNAEGITSGTTIFSGFYVYGADALTSGGSSYAVHVKGCNASLKFVNNQIIAGNGRPGVAGDDGDDGEDGEDGGLAFDAHDIGHITCSATDWNPGAPGGTKLCGSTDVSGGDGGTATCPDFDESGTQPKSIPYNQTQASEVVGGDGQGSGGGAGGLAGYDSIMWDGAYSTCSICNSPRAEDGGAFLPSLGSSGENGSDGDEGGYGAGCASGAGSVTSGLWNGSAGTVGGTGIHGGGGGGGGAGGGVESQGCTTVAAVLYTDVGGGGGGGGSGGCRGTGGSGGQPGGGSFGFFIVGDSSLSTLPVLTGNLVQNGFGGDGGNGGNGGVGGSGGKGTAGGLSGEADPAGWCADAGGFGGNGGRGGHGGGGGGGCGGASFAIYLSGASTSLGSSYLLNNEFLLLGGGGTGGQGGKSLGESGQKGNNGAQGKANF